MRRLVLLRCLAPPLLLLAACRAEQPVEAVPPGDPFEIVLAPGEAEPDQPPGFDGDTLVVRVRYSGGCESHRFALDAETRSDTTLLALRHDANGDGCEALVYDELRLGLEDPLPPDGPVLLRNPQGGPPFRIDR